MKKTIFFVLTLIVIAAAALLALNFGKTPVVQAPGENVPPVTAPTGTETGKETGGGTETNQPSQCVCPAGYRQEGNACNPECYYSTPKCLAPSFICGQDGNGVSNGSGDNGNAGGDAGMANPASVYCEQQGGRLDIRTDVAGGQYGVCVMPNGVECEEWDFFRTKVCSPSSGAGTGNSAVCERENCHGLEIKCGATPAEVCTMMYQLGDKCLQYAKCGVVGGVCRQISDPQFDACKSCVQKCQNDFGSDQIKLFDCESKCQ